MDENPGNRGNKSAQSESSLVSQTPLELSTHFSDGDGDGSGKNSDFSNEYLSVHFCWIENSIIFSINISVRGYGDSGCSGVCPCDV